MDGGARGPRCLATVSVTKPLRPRRKNPNVYEATHLESRTYHTRVAVCRLCTDQRDDTQRMSPVPQATLGSLQPDGFQGDAIRVHGEPFPDMGGRSQTQVGQSAGQVLFSAGQGPDTLRGSRQRRRADISGKAIDVALKVTLPPETRPGVRVDQATARLARAQKLQVELKRSSSRSKQLYRTISRRLPWPRPSSRTQSALSSQAPQPQILAQPVSPSAERSLPNFTGFYLLVRKAWPAMRCAEKTRPQENPGGCAGRGRHTSLPKW